MLLPSSRVEHVAKLFVFFLNGDNPRHVLLLAGLSRAQPTRMLPGGLQKADYHSSLILRSCGGLFLVTGALQKETKWRTKSRQAECVAYLQGVLRFLVEFVWFREHGMHFSVIFGWCYCGAVFRKRQFTGRKPACQATLSSKSEWNSVPCSTVPLLYRRVYSVRRYYH